MNNSLSQQFNVQDEKRLALKMYQLFSKGDIKILDEHKQFFSNHLRLPGTSPDGSAEAQGDSQDKPSGSGRNEQMAIIHIAEAYVDQEGKGLRTPLHLSAIAGNTELVNIFLKAGADINAGDRNKYTSLHLSAENGHKEVVETLLRAGANVDAKHSDKKTPLHLSAATGHKEVVETLLKAGADVNAESTTKHTPIYCSIFCGHDDVTNLLLRAGASVKERDNFGRTCLDCMDDRQRVRCGFEPRKLFKLRNWMYSLTNNKKHVQSSTCTKTKTEHTETISAAFTDVDSRTPEESNTLPFWDSTAIHNEESSNNNGQDETSRDSPNLLTSGTPLRKAAGTSSSPQPLCRPLSPAESHDLNDKDLQEMSNIRQQVENHLSKFSLETTEGCEMRCSHDVKAASQAGRVVIPTTLNVTLNKVTKNTTKVQHHYEPGTNLNISHAENVAPGGQIVVHQNRKGTTAHNDDDNDDDDEDDSSSKDDSYINI